MNIFDYRGGIRRSTAVLFAAFQLWPAGTARSRAISEPEPPAPEHVADAGVRPGDDFFAFANNDWLKATAIPAGKQRWGARDEINEVTAQQIASLLDDARSAPAGSEPRKVADFRAAWLNAEAIEAKGITPLRPSLVGIERLRDKAALTRWLGREMRADVDPLNWGVYQSSHVLGLSVEESIHGEKTYVAFLLQGGLGLPDRENYLGPEPRMQALRTKYAAYITKMLSLAGFDRTEERAAAVLALETALAESQGTPEASANDRNADLVWTRAEFGRQAPGMDWSVFFAAAGLAKQGAFVPWQPSAVKGVAALVKSQPLPVWRDYLRFHLLDENADILPHAFAEAALAMHGGSGARTQRALDATKRTMSEPIGRLYAQRYFPAAQKARVQAIVANVLAAFMKRVEAATWMSPATKTQALAKLKALYLGVGYPERWQDFIDLSVDPLDAVGNLRRIADRNYRHAVARIGQPVDMKEWWIAPQTAGAVLIFQLNEYDFSAALLQAPKYDPAASDAANYGAIGAIFGHDISHFVDVLGAEYDPTGAMRPWWQPGEKARFEALAEPLARQFSEYRPFPDAAVDGKRTQTENIADLAGLSAAFDAYRRTLGSRADDKASD